MADIEKLKGCPFCGNEPRTSCGYGQRGATVECLCGDCPVNTSVYIEAMQIENVGLDIDGALKSAIAAWNARTHSPLCRQGDETDALLAAAKCAALTFRHYEQLHKSKNPPDYDKARRNLDHALALEAAIGRYGQKSPPTDDLEKLLASVPPIEAINALKRQRQIDRDGDEVGVNRQACDEIAEFLYALTKYQALKEKK